MTHCAKVQLYTPKHRTLLCRSDLFLEFSRQTVHFRFVFLQRKGAETGEREGTPGGGEDRSRRGITLYSAELVSMRPSNTFIAATDVEENARTGFSAAAHCRKAVKRRNSIGGAKGWETSGPGL